MPDLQTGMDRAEMKRFLLKSKQEPVNCALGVGDDKSVALLMLSPHRSAKALQGDLQKQFPSAFNTRFGTAVVDTEDDPTLVKFMLNKAVTSMARRLVKTLKGTGFRKVQILLEDGSPVEGAAEEEGAAQTASQEAANPDAAALSAALAALAQRIAGIADPARKEALAKQAREANVNIKVGNLTYAATGIESLRRALDALVTAASSDSMAEQPKQSAPPPPPEPQASRPDVAALTAALAELVRRIAGIANPAGKEALAKQAREANVNIKTGNLTYAAASIEQLRIALEAPTPSPTTAAPAAARPFSPVAYAKARLAWLGARQKMASEIERLGATIYATYRGDAANLEKRFRERVAPVLAGLDESLADKLDEATNSAEPAKRAVLVNEAKAIMQRYQAVLANEPIIADLDANPFAPVAIQQTITMTLDTLSKVLA
jgi:hypothetical protein